MALHSVPCKQLPAASGSGNPEHSDMLARSCPVAGALLQKRAVPQASTIGTLLRQQGSALGYLCSEEPAF